LIDVKNVVSAPVPVNVSAANEPLLTVGAIGIGVDVMAGTCVGFGVGPTLKLAVAVDTRTAPGEGTAGIKVAPGAGVEGAWRVGCA